MDRNTCINGSVCVKRLLGLTAIAYTSSSKPVSHNPFEVTYQIACIFTYLHSNSNYGYEIAMKIILWLGESAQHEELHERVSALEWLEA